MEDQNAMQPNDAPTDAPQSPPPAWEGAPTPTPDDPTASGYYCGARRHPGQIEQDRQAGRDPWPWCRNRAGFGTDHTGLGACKYHAGSTTNARKNARLRLDELVGPALSVLARMLTDPNVPPSIRLRAAQDVLDRSGHPRRVDIDVDAARANLVERIMALQSGEEAEN